MLVPNCSHCLLTHPLHQSSSPSIPPLSDTIIPRSSPPPPPCDNHIQPPTLLLIFFPCSQPLSAAHHILLPQLSFHFSLPPLQPISFTFSLRHRHNAHMPAETNLGFLGYTVHLDPWPDIKRCCASCLFWLKTRELRHYSKDIFP